MQFFVSPIDGFCFCLLLYGVKLNTMTLFFTRMSATKYFSDLRVLAFVSGLLYAFAGLYFIFFLVWICLVPLLIGIYQKSVKEFVLAGLIFGATMSLVAFTWMISKAGIFTGGGFAFGFLALLIAIMVSALYWGIFLYALAWIRVLLTSPTILCGLMVASLWVLLEFVLNIPLDGLPWFSRHTGYALTGNLYAIQPAAFFGEHVLTFITVLVNYLVAMALIQRKWRLLMLPLLLVIFYVCAGVMIQQKFENRTVSSRKSFKLTIVSENIPPEIKWNDRTGNILVRNLLHLNEEAVRLKPGMVLWSESAIPWTYKPDDDLVNEILKSSKPEGVTHIMGMNTEYYRNKLYNSVYCILPDGSVASRYDKCTALDFIEKPLGGFLIPFFSENGSSVQEGQNPQPLNTPYGKAGVMICNESFLSNAAATMVKKGAEFFVNPSNDGWFRNTMIVGQHFFAARLRAVETRKDIAINSNNGMSGLIQASGRIAMARQDEQSYVETVTILPNKEVSLYTRHPYLWLYWCIAYLFCFIFFKFKQRMRSKITQHEFCQKL